MVLKIRMVIPKHPPPYNCEGKIALQNIAM
jgi:hypothetical protein